MDIIPTTLVKKKDLSHNYSAPTFEKRLIICKKLSHNVKKIQKLSHNVKKYIKQRQKSRKCQLMASILNIKNVKKKRRFKIVKKKKKEAHDKKSHLFLKM